MEWISVKDKLPSKNGRYLVARVTALGAFIDIIRYTLNYEDPYDFVPHLKGRAIWYTYNDVEDYEVDGVTHWMQLPEHPNSK